MATDLSSSPSVLTGAQQTMGAWTKVIESYAAIPEIYKYFFKSSLGDLQTFPYVVLAPALTRVRKATEKLVYEVNDTLYVLARTGTEIVAHAYPLKTICDIEVGTILLYSWLTIHGMTSAGLMSATTIEFNSTSLRHYATFIAKIRPQPNVADDTELQKAQAAFDYLATENFKFMNYARSSLVGGEKVIHTLWQPEIRERIFPRLRVPFYRTVSTAHLAVLTDKELILIREDERSSRGKKGVRYGGVWHYIPLRNIVSVSLEQFTADLLILSVKLSSMGHADQLFALASRPEVTHLQNAIEKALGSSMV